MSQQMFAEAVRESRLFFRRRLAERLAVAQIRTTGGVDVAVVVKRAKELTDALWRFEEVELGNQPVADSADLRAPRTVNAPARDHAKKA